MAALHHSERQEDTAEHQEEDTSGRRPRPIPGSTSAKSQKSKTSKSSVGDSEAETTSDHRFRRGRPDPFRRKHEAKPPASFSWFSGLLDPELLGAHGHGAPPVAYGRPGPLFATLKEGPGGLSRTLWKGFLRKVGVDDG